MNDLDVQWAWGRVEAMAEGSLPASEARRMHAAMARDPRLRAEVAAAVALRQRLRQLGRTPVPPALRRRLLAIGGEQRPVRGDRTGAHTWKWALTGGVALVLGVALLTSLPRRPSPAPDDSAAATLQQVDIAMAYLQRSSEIAGGHVTRALRNSAVTAAAASRRAIQDDDRANSED